VCWRQERTECDGVFEQCFGERRGEVVTVFGNRVLEGGHCRVSRYLGTVSWREERRGSYGVLGTGCWRKETAECDGVWEQGPG